MSTITFKPVIPADDYENKERAESRRRIIIIISVLVCAVLAIGVGVVLAVTKGSLEDYREGGRRE
jgi:flagellar basal body-associated protein FliL